MSAGASQLLGKRIGFPYPGTFGEEPHLMKRGKHGQTSLHDGTYSGSATCTMSILFVHLGAAVFTRLTCA
jgi:hypothetical protein